MHLFKVAFFATGIAYSFINPLGIAIYGGILLTYWVLSNLVGGTSRVSNARKVAFGTWSEPKEGNLYIHEEIRVDKVEQFLENNYPKQERPTLTHVVVRATAQALKAVPTMNGKVTFGKFVPFKSVDVSVLVELASGNDLAMMLLSDCENKTFEDLKEVIAKKSAKMRSSTDGGEEHKKRTGAANFLPSFVLAATMKVVKFITCDLGFNLKALGMRRDGFGVAMITAIGKLGFMDATAPFTSFANNSLILAINKVYDRVTIEDGKVSVGKFININIVIDNRLYGQTNNRQFLPAFRKVFENPQEYTRLKGIKQVASR